MYKGGGEEGMGCAPQCCALLGQKSLSDSLELKSQAIVSQLTWVLGTELWAVCTYNCRIISAAPLLCSWSTHKKKKVKSNQVINLIFFFITVYFIFYCNVRKYPLTRTPKFCQNDNACCLWTLLCPDKQWNFTC